MNECGLRRLLLTLLLLGGSATVQGEPGAGKVVWEKWNHDYMKNSKRFLYDSFPANFLWGVGSSAFQIEGGWKKDGKGPSVWDLFTHNEFSRFNNTTADISSSSYTFLEKDLEALEFLGVSSYLFSISWPRLFPNGEVESVNVKGLQYYNTLIDSLIQRNITPIVTLYHWDLPFALQEQHGGWTSQAMVDIFNQYAKFCFQTFGDRVKFWITIHNPFLIAWHGYKTGNYPPGQRNNLAAMYTVGHNMIKAHAKVWHTYDKQFRKSQKGFVSIVLGSHWIKPKNENYNYKNFQRSMDMMLGWFAKPIFVDGDYPESLKTQTNPSLPMFTDKEKYFINGTADFFAFSFGPYNFRLLEDTLKLKDHLSLHLGQVLNWIKMEYNNPRIFIAENGWFSDNVVKTEDTIAIYLMKKFINELLKVIRFDGVNVFGYTAWSLLDGFEWQFGYTIARGLFYVDFSSKKKSRIAKSSARFYKQIIEQNGFPMTEDSRRVNGQFPCDFSWGVAESALPVNKAIFSPEFVDHSLYIWNCSGDQKLYKVMGVTKWPRPAQCTDFSNFKQHVALVKKMNVTQFSFAFKWSQILPRGDRSNINRSILSYYRCIISELLKLNIASAVTLYHPTHRDVDVPKPLLRQGGWLNKQTAVAFQDYAKLCFQEFGDLVKLWLTMHEPNMNVEGSLEPYRAAHNMIIAHALAWHTYNRDFRDRYHGLVSLTLRADWVEPANPFLESHQKAAQRLLQFHIAWFADPIFKTGDYPHTMRDYILMKNRKNLTRSFLLHFSGEEKEMIRGSADFFALSHFTTRLIYPLVHKPNTGSRYEMDHDGSLLRDVTLLTIPSPSHLFFPFPSRRHYRSEMAVTPSGIRRVLKWIKLQYGNVDIYITANGVWDSPAISDELRIYYHKHYINEVLKAHLLDQVNVKGYFALTLKDKHTNKQPSRFLNASEPKSSLEFYNKLIIANGFPLGTTSKHCPREKDIPVQCPVCVFIREKQIFIFLGSCLLLIAVLFAAIIIIRRRK
ncbi:LOW QUALITY PROTEIN: beta-klotho [Amblyraja radiata]|uniref:LOW QUALITY PROTEIN: beta-klotho n=1 Tax=Amblyraja radiata TaxID=386614 RepID=UPI0014033149|nr:LOW QUALITY PROTEIN: beta-klotho [Amblyraja radiata]